MKILILILFSLNVVYGENEIGEECEKNGVKGVCRLEKDCAKFIEKNMRIAIKHKCKFLTHDSISICCPNPTEQEDLKNYCKFREFESSEISNSQPVIDICDRVSHGCIAKGKYPHIAALAYKNDNGGYDFRCGGSLISKKYVLTSAHCLMRGLTFVRLGKNNLDELIYDDEKNDYFIANTTFYPDYRNKSIQKYSDIALLKLNETVKFNEFIYPACLFGNIKINDFIIAGFGGTENTKKLSNQLSIAKVKELTAEQCVEQFVTEDGGSLLTGMGLSQGVTNQLICAWNNVTGADSCRGDSGNGIINFNERFQIYNLVGITAFGYECHIKKSKIYPGFYIRVSEFKDWILTSISGD